MLSWAHQASVVLELRDSCTWIARQGGQLTLLLEQYLPFALRTTDKAHSILVYVAKLVRFVVSVFRRADDGGSIPLRPLTWRLLDVRQVHLVCTL